jgi:1-pyrroline-5-carboxylate dehydrogenase
MTSSRTGLPPIEPTTPWDYSAGSPERARFHAAVADLAAVPTEVPCRIGADLVHTGTVDRTSSPHDHQLRLADVHLAGPAEMEAAIKSALAAAPEWSRLPWQERAEPFLKAADLLQLGPWRDRLNAATSLELSKTTYQADIDAACETVDFLRMNVKTMLDAYAVQPASLPGTWNSMDYRPLEGFVLAVSPFNFTCMANLAAAPATVGNVVVWKPAEGAQLVAHLVMDLLTEAGLPAGVINVVYGDGAALAPTALSHPDLAGVHFTGSTATFKSIWRSVADNLDTYRNYPRVVGETGGKDFILAHPSADVEALAVACVRGAFEFQGQKCSAPSRLFAPRSLWPALSERLRALSAEVVTGDPTRPETFVGAVIDEASHRRLEAALAEARTTGEVLVGGTSDASTGWFIAPTIVRVDDPGHRLMRDELFGPILTCFVYDDDEWDAVLGQVDRGSPYGLTGAVFAQDRAAAAQAADALRYTAGNFYVNDKPTGSVVGLQPFGGARASGTNDKAGTVWNTIRWMSPRAIKEQHLPPRSWAYPHLEPDA